MNSKHGNNSELEISLYEKDIMKFLEHCDIKYYDLKAVQLILRYMHKYVDAVYNKADIFRLNVDK